MNDLPSQQPPLIYKPLRPFVRAILITLGTLALGIGIVGIYLPALPTTPFLLMAAACYMRSSERLFNWIVKHPRIGPQIQVYLARKAIPLKVKAFSLVVAWSMLLGLALFVVESTVMKALLIALAVIKTIIMVRVKTLREDV